MRRTGEQTGTQWLFNMCIPSTTVPKCAGLERKRELQAHSYAPMCRNGEGWRTAGAECAQSFKGEEEQEDCERTSTLALTWERDTEGAQMKTAMKSSKVVRALQKNFQGPRRAEEGRSTTMGPWIDLRALVKLKGHKPLHKGAG